MFAARFYSALLLVGPLFVLASSPQVRGDDQPTDISTAANVDENLFVLRALGREYNQWPEKEWDGKTAVDFCENGRLHVKYLRKVAAQRGLDPDIRRMCTDYLTLMDEYESTLAALGKIDDEARSKAFDDAFKTFIISSIKGLKAGEEAAEQGKNELGVDAAVGQKLIDDGLMQYIKNSKARDAQTANTAQAEQARFEKVVSYADAQNQAIVRQLTEKYHWTAGEGGFELKGDEPLEAIARRMPRDPFIKLEQAVTGIPPKPTGDDLMNRANLCIEATRLIPADNAYDDYRLESLSTAAQYACDSADMGLGLNFRDTPTPHAQEAINIARALLKLAPEDKGGWAHVGLFRALADAGRLNDAVDAARPVLTSAWKDHLAFVLRYARVMGAAGDADNLDRWLRMSYNLGFSDLKFVADSHDFDCLRAQKPAAYAELTTIKGKTRFDVGFVDDDITLVNKSPFPMTNVKVKCTVIKDGHVQTAERTFPFVAANAESTMTSVFHINGYTYDQFRWTLSSDQGKLSSEDE